MEGFLEITLDVSNHYGISVDILANPMMQLGELVYETLSGMNLALISIDNIILKVERDGTILTQSETLLDGNVRNGDVLILN